MNMYSHIHFVVYSSLVLSSCQDTIMLDVPSGGVTDIAINGKLVHGDPSICTLLAGVGEEVSVLRPSYWPRAN